MRIKRKSLLPFLTLFISIVAWAQSYELELPVYDGAKYLGEVQASVEGDKILWIDKESLIPILSPHLGQDTLDQLKKLPDRIKATSFPLPLEYDAAQLQINLTLKMKQRSRNSLNLLDEYQLRFKDEALRPAPIAGALNYQLQQNWANQDIGNDFFSAQFNSFLNLNTFVLENQSFYQSNQDKKWFRGDTRLIKDIENKQVRFQLGDIYPQIQGFMSPQPIGGVSISRNFSLNPYRLPYPTGVQNFTINSRSLVNYFVNGSLIRSEYLAPGNYTAKDIPLNNGLNTIIVEATDDLGQKKVFIFRSAASINLLNEGESRFDISHGIPFIDQNFNRDYQYSDGKLTSGFYQYGFSSSFSLSGYGQNRDDFSLLGAELIKATSIGNFSLGHASSMDPEDKGDAQSLSYQLIGQGSQWLMSQTLGLRYEHRSTDFKSTKFDISSIIQNNYAINYTLPLASVLTASLGVNYGDVRDNNLSDRYGFDTTLNLRLFDHHNLSFFVGRNRDENKIWNDVAYVFLTIAFPSSNDFVSTFYDQQQNATKVTYIKDNQNRLYKPRAQAQVENNNTQQFGEVDVLVPTPFADFGGRIYGAHLIENDTVASKASLRLNSSFVFAAQDGDVGFGISRPITNSFILLKPEDRLRDQKIALRSTSPFSEAETGIFKEMTFNNLLAYQYREVQLDPTLMDEGRTLTQEKYIVYPTYRSGHLIKLLEKGAVILVGKLKKADGSLLALQVGQLSGTKTFFTNRDGDFFIEGVEPGVYELKLEGHAGKAMLRISKDETGLKDIGTIVLEEEL